MGSPEFSQFVSNCFTLLSLLINSFILFFLWTKESPSYSVVHLGTFELKAKLKRHLKFE